MTGDDDMPKVIGHLSPFGWANRSPTWGVVTHTLEVEQHDVDHVPKLHRWVCTQVKDVGDNLGRFQKALRSQTNTVTSSVSIFYYSNNSMNPGQTGSIELTTRWWDTADDTADGSCVPFTVSNKFWIWVKRLTALSRQRAPSPRWTLGGRVKASVLARGRRGSQQQGCEKKMKRGKRIFSRVSAAGNPAPRAPGLWTDTPLRLVVPDKISRLFQGQQLQRTEESPPPETHLTASECVACCRPPFFHSVFSAARSTERIYPDHLVGSIFKFMYRLP